MTAVLWILLVLAVLYLLAGLFLALLACRRFTGALDPLRGLTHATDELLSPYEAILVQGQTWLREHPHQRVEMTSFDGLRLRASLYEHPQARAVLVACHGYHSNGVRDFASAMHFYYSYGFSILLIDQRAAGDSEGRYVTFGVRESVDARDWCALMQERFPELPVLLVGISLGASTVLMTADDLPGNVKALLTDCGYTSPWDELSYVARRYVPLAGPLVLPSVDLFCRLIAGFGLRERSAETALARCSLPVFFVHGEADTLVPFQFSLRNRAACAGPSFLLAVPGAEHGISYLVDQEGYHRAVDDFLKTFLPALADPIPAGESD